MTVKELRAIINCHTIIVLVDRNSDEGIVFEGKELIMKTIWDSREILWLRPYNQRIHIDI